MKTVTVCRSFSEVTYVKRNIKHVSKRWRNLLVRTPSSLSARPTSPRIRFWMRDIYKDKLRDTVPMISATIDVLKDAVAAAVCVAKEQVVLAC
jgi:hypothetical protein